MSAAKRRKPRATTSPAVPGERQAILRVAFLADLAYWIRSEPRIALRIMLLINDMLRNPFDGLGKPEPLRHGQSGLWSRRVTGTHRVVYEVHPAGVLLHVARGHYDRD